MRFPILVQAERQVEIRLLCKPMHMGANFGALPMAVVAVQINPTAVLAAIEREAGRIKTGAKQSAASLAQIFSEQAQRGERPGGSVAMDFGEDIDRRRGEGKSRRKAIN